MLRVFSLLGRILEFYPDGLRWLKFTDILPTHDNVTK